MCLPGYTGAACDQCTPGYGPDPSQGWAAGSRTSIRDCNGCAANHTGIDCRQCNSYGTLCRDANSATCKACKAACPAGFPGYYNGYVGCKKCGSTDINCRCAPGAVWSNTTKSCGGCLGPRLLHAVRPLGSCSVARPSMLVAGPASPVPHLKPALPASAVCGPNAAAPDCKCKPGYRPSSGAACNACAYGFVGDYCYAGRPGCPAGYVGYINCKVELAAAGCRPDQQPAHVSQLLAAAAMRLCN